MRIHTVAAARARASEYKGALKPVILIVAATCPDVVGLAFQGGSTSLSRSLLDFPDDVWLSSMLSRLTAKSLILLSMVARRGKQLVDNAPAQLSIW